MQDHSRLYRVREIVLPLTTEGSGMNIDDVRNAFPDMNPADIKETGKGFQMMDRPCLPSGVERILDNKCKHIEGYVFEWVGNVPPDLSVCPNCGGVADNGHDRCVPPNAYWCTKCDISTDGSPS